MKDESASEVEDQTNVKSSEDPTDLELEVMEQGRLIIQLKEMIRERDETLNNKETEIKVSCLHLKSISSYMFLSSLKKHHRIFLKNQES